MNSTTTRRLATIAALALAVAGPAAACSSDTEVSASDAWARSGTAGGNTAVYMVLEGGSEPDDLVGASVPSDVAAAAEVHETRTEGGMDGEMDDMGDMSDGEGSGMMTMQEVEMIPVPADGSVTLEPGGYHIMVLDLQADLSAGDTVPVTLVFSSGAEETLDVEVRDV